MRAAVCRRFGAPLSVEVVELDGPAGDEVRVDIRACAVCHSDVAYVDGAWGGPLPTIFGHEAAGVVAEVGRDVASVAPGDRVVVTLVRSCGNCAYCAAGNDVLCETEFRLDTNPGLRDSAAAAVHQGLRTGAFAEQVVVHESQLASIGEDIPLEAAALLACGVVTGFGAVTKTARVPAGASVAVLGVGGVGLNCIQGAVFSKAGQVVAVDLRNDKLDVARSLGATATVNAAETDAVAAVADLTSGRGADYVFVAAGSATAVEAAQPLLSRAGSLVIVGMPATGDTAAIDTGNLAHYGQRVLGSKMGSVRVAEDIPMLAALYREGRLQLEQLISGVYRLDAINEAIDSARAGAAIRNLIVFE